MLVHRKKMNLLLLAQQRESRIVIIDWRKITIMKLFINHLSSCYTVRLMSEEDIENIYNICKENPTCYDHMKSKPTIENVKEDMTMLPPGKTKDDKFFIGFYEKDQLIAIMDLITGYPNNNTAFIGLFMMNKNYQGIGIGSNIIEEVLYFLKFKGYSYVRLGYIKGNLQSKAFWTKNKFNPAGIESERESYTIVVMQRTL